MSSAICTSVGCKNGRAAVTQMWFTFEYLQDNYPAFNATRFSPTVESIQAALDAVDSWYADLIPFNPTCCTIEDIGAQSESLTNNMLASVGAVNVPEAPAPTDWTSLVLIGGTILLLAVYSPQIKKLL